MSLAWLRFTLLELDATASVSSSTISFSHASNCATVIFLSKATPVSSLPATLFPDDAGVVGTLVIMEVRMVEGMSEVRDPLSDVMDATGAVTAAGESVTTGVAGAVEVDDWFTLVHDLWLEDAGVAVWAVVGPDPPVAAVVSSLEQATAAKDETGAKGGARDPLAAEATDAADIAETLAE